MKKKFFFLKGSVALALLLQGALFFSADSFVNAKSYVPGGKDIWIEICRDVNGQAVSYGAFCIAGTGKCRENPCTSGE